jgi:hypothetical protein
MLQWISIWCTAQPFAIGDFPTCPQVRTRATSPPCGTRRPACRSYIAASAAALVESGVRVAGGITFVVSRPEFTEEASRTINLCEAQIGTRIRLQL